MLLNFTVIWESKTVAANRVAAINPLSTIRARYGNAVSTPEATRTCKNPAEFSPKAKPIRNVSIDPTSAIRTRLRTPFLRTPFLRLLSRGNKRDKLKGTNGAEFAVFRRFSLMIADFRFSWELQHFRGADFRRKPQQTADFRRNPFVPFPDCPF